MNLLYRFSTTLFSFLGFLFLSFTQIQLWFIRPKNINKKVLNLDDTFSFFVHSNDKDSIIDNWIWGGFFNIH